MQYVHLNTQKTVVPGEINGTINPQNNLDVMLNAGWRLRDALPEPAAGYERGPITWIQDPARPEYAVAQYTDTLIQDRLDAEAAIRDAQIAEYAAAMADQAVYMNTFLLLCDAISGTSEHAKLTFEQITGLLLALRAASSPDFEKYRDASNLLDAALKTKRGNDWWTYCVWDATPEIVTAAEGMFAQLMG